MDNREKKSVFNNLIDYLEPKSIIESDFIF